MEKVRIHFIGTSDGFPMLEENCSACVFERNGAFWMIDAGDGAETGLQRQGIRTGDLEALVVTHWHNDHYYGAPAILSQMKKKRAYLPVPEAFGETFASFLRVFHDVNQAAAPLEFHRLTPGMEMNFAGVAVRSFETAHMSPALSPENRTQFCAHSLECRTPEGKRILFSGDLGSHVHELNFWKLPEEETDLLVLEGAHILPLHKVIARLRDKPIRHLVFTHIWRRGIRPERLVREFSQALGIPVYAAIDGDYAEFHDKEMTFHHRVELASAMPPDACFSAEARVERFRSEGIPLRWKCIGPFPNPKIDGEYVGLKQDPENRLLADADKECSGSYLSADGEKITWLTMTAEDFFPDGMLPLCHFFPGANAVNYAVTDLEITHTGTYTVLWSCDAACRMRMDGKDILYYPRKQNAVKDDRSFEIELTRGRHRLVVIQDTREGGYGVYFRIVPKENGRRKMRQG